jgi:chromosome segregation ATPase
MHKARLLEVAVVLLALLLATGCAETYSASNSSRAAEEAGARARAEQTQAGTAAKKALDERLKELQLRIDAMKADAKPAKAKSRRAADSEMDKLHEEVTELRSKLSSPTGRTEEWDKLKDDTEQAFKRIEQKVDSLGRPTK